MQFNIAVNSATNVLYVLDCQYRQDEGTVATSQKKYNNRYPISLSQFVSINIISINIFSIVRTKAQWQHEARNTIIGISGPCRASSSASAWSTTWSTASTSVSSASSGRRRSGDMRQEIRQLVSQVVARPARALGITASVPPQ